MGSLAHLSERIAKTFDVALVGLGNETTGCVVVSGSKVHCWCRIESRQLKRNANPVADMLEIAGKVFEATDKIDDRFSVVSQERFLQLESAIAAPANVIVEVSQCSDFNVISVCGVVANVAIVRQLPVPGISDESKTEHSIELRPANFANQIGDLKMIPTAWRSKLGNTNSLEHKVRALVPGRHRVTPHGPLDAGSGGLENVYKDELASVRNNHAFRNIILRQQGQEKWSLAVLLSPCFQRFRCQQAWLRVGLQMPVARESKGAIRCDG